MDQEEFIEAVAEKVGEKLGIACEAVLPNTSDRCKNVLFSPVSTARFYRSCRTEIDVVEAGAIPLAPGASVTLSQATHPGWLAGCFMITYRLANDGKNHGDVKFEWFLDDEPLDTAMWGSEIYDNANGMIGDGKHPVPLHCGVQCCIGAMNKLKLKITHTGVANQVEAIRVFVLHGVQACCSACASGKACQTGCNNHHKPQKPPKQQPLPPVPVMQGGNNVTIQLPAGMKLVNGG